MRFNESIYASLLVATFAVLLVAVCYMGRTRCTNVDENPDAIEWNGEQSLRTHSGSGDTETIKLPCFTELAFEAGEISQEVNIYNPESNSCYMDVTIWLDDYELWRSGAFSPGKGFNKITINKPLDEGVYNAVCKIECRAFDGSQLNGANFEFTLFAD